MISDKKSNKPDLKEEYFGSTGQKIRKIRERKGVTAPQLAANCGITKGAMSLYENGLRQISDEKRKAIADALGISEKALKDYQFRDDLDILFALFEMEERGYIQPQVIGDRIEFLTANPLLQSSITVWSEKYQQCENGSLSAEDYADWKDSFFPDQTIPAEHMPMESADNGVYSSEIRSLQLLRQTMEYDISQVQHYIDTDDVLGISQSFETLQRNLLNWLDQDIEKMIEKNKG